METINGIEIEECGCRYNWNDKFYESHCDEHGIEYRSNRPEITDEELEAMAQRSFEKHSPLLNEFMREEKPIETRQTF